MPEWISNFFAWLFQIAVDWVCHTCKRKVSCIPPAPVCPSCQRVMVRATPEPKK